MGRGIRQVLVPAELRDYLRAHGFWQQGTTVMFYVKMTNPEAGSYLCKMPKKAFEKAEK